MTAVSLLFTTIASVGILTINQFDIVGRIIVALMVIIDVYTNLICVLLSYSYFNGAYDRLCGLADSKCNDLCHYVTGNAESLQMQMVANISVASISQIQSEKSTPVASAAEIKDVHIVPITPMVSMSLQSEKSMDGNEPSIQTSVQTSVHKVHD